MKLAKWIITGKVSYISTMLIKNFAFNPIASVVIWRVSLYFLNKVLEK